MKRLDCFVLPFIFLLFSISLFAQNGLLAEYYDGTSFERKVATRIDNNIDMYWNETPPVRGINPHKCSIRWTGRIKTSETGVYTFSARVDDGIRVWVGGRKVIDDWGLNDVGIFEGKVEMEAGRYYDLKVEYFNALIEGEITLMWSLPNDEQSWFDEWWNGKQADIIPSEAFYQPRQQEVVYHIDPSEEEDRKAVREEVVEEPAPAPPKVEKKQPKPVAKPPKKVKETPPAAPEVVHIDTIERYIPKNIQFDRAKTDILEASFDELNRLAEFLLEQSHLKVQIGGHTDYVGDAYKNVILSQDRADAVAAYLMDKGIEKERISAKGYGGSKPLVKNDGRKYHPENRRVEFVIN